MSKIITLVIITLVLPLTLIGCITVETKTCKDNEEHLALIDQKVSEFEKQIEDLDYNTKNLTTRIEMLTQKNMSMDAKYSNLYETLNTLSADIDAKNSSLETSLSYLTNDIEDLEKHLDEIEKTNSDLQNQIVVLQNQRSRIISSKTGHEEKVTKEQLKEMPSANASTSLERIKDTKEEIQFTEQEAEENREIEETTEEEAEAIEKAFAKEETKELSDTQKNELLQKLLDEALELYREGSYQEALMKWEEVLEIEPDNLESKFNIEITKEKIKSLSEN